MIETVSLDEVTADFSETAAAVFRNITELAPKSAWIGSRSER